MPKKSSSVPTAERMSKQLESTRAASAEPRSQDNSNNKDVPFDHPPFKRSRLPNFARKWVPDYTRIFAELIMQAFVGVAYMIKGIYGLTWYHILYPPAGIYYFASLWLAGFVSIPDQVERTGPEPWFNRYVGVVSFPNESNPQSEKTGMWWVPLTDVRWAFTHGLMVRGLTHLQMFSKTALFFPQLLFASMWRCTQFHFGFGAWKPNGANGHQTYLSIVNTSLGTYYDSAANAFVYHDCIILSDYNQSQRKFSKITVFCDHKLGEVTHMLLTVAADPIWGIEAADIQLDSTKDTIIPVVTRTRGTVAARKGDTDKPYHMTKEEAVEEMAVIITQIGALMTHPQVHWWANGVNEVKQWKLHETSSRWTQFLNYLATKQSLFFYHAPFANDTDLLGKNLVGGMPLHNNIPKEVTQWSTAHPMVTEARGLIKAHFAKVNTPISEEELNCLLCATIFHAADHHYLNKYCCRNGLSQILKTDFRVMRVCIVGGYRWLGTKFLCKQYKDVDPICKILYDVALKHDPEFAEGLLTIGIAI